MNSNDVRAYYQHIDEINDSQQLSTMIGNGIGDYLSSFS